jgi:hypothetical protein
MDTPAELHTRVTALLDTVSAIRKQVRELQYEYSALNEDHLGVDNLGPAVSAAEALAASKLALARIDDTMICTVDAVYDAMQHSSRLKTLA